MFSAPIRDGSARNRGTHVHWILCSLFTVLNGSSQGTKSVGLASCRQFFVGRHEKPLWQLIRVWISPDRPISIQDPDFLCNVPCNKCSFSKFCHRRESGRHWIHLFMSIRAQADLFDYSFASFQTTKNWCTPRFETRQRGNINWWIVEIVRVWFASYS